MTGTHLPAASELDRFRAAVARRLGLSLQGRSAGELEATWRRRAAANDARAPAYLQRLESPEPWPAETAKLAEELTVGETYFFRNAEQFRALSGAVLPARARAAAAGEPIRLLSAACSTGEEAYSLAIAARETPELAGRPLVVHGIDVNPAGLARAATARYTPWALRETSPEMRARYFRASGRELVLAPELRAAVVFEQRNLAGDQPPGAGDLGRFDVVFCRNLLMYLTPEAARGVVAWLARALLPGGYLFLGHAETLRGISDDFELAQTHGTFYYRRREVAGARRDDPRPAEPGDPIRRDPPPPDPMVRGGHAWIDDIHRSSERIRTLTAPPAAGLPPAGAPADGAAVLDEIVDLLGQERLADARAALDRLPAEIAESPRGLLVRAVLSSHGDDLAAAERLCERLLDLDRRDAGACFLKALCAQRAGDLRAATERHRLAAALDPAFAMPRLHLGLLARRAQQPTNARRELERALPLLEREDRVRLALFGGGFGRPALLALCRAELAACGGAR